MQKYYTAVGRFERKGRMGDMTCPMVIINKREYALDIQEMILWATLNWQIMDARVLEDTYIAKLQASGIASARVAKITGAFHGAMPTTTPQGTRIAIAMRPGTSLGITLP